YVTPARPRCLIVRFVFFFQAEDGIRDLYVTGVQTCALPISPAVPRCDRGCRGAAQALAPVLFADAGGDGRSVVVRAAERSGPLRSEERRVGKECRSRGSRDH